MFSLSFSKYNFSANREENFHFENFKVKYLFRVVAFFGYKKLLGEPKPQAMSEKEMEQLLATNFSDEDVPEIPHEIASLEPEYQNENKELDPIEENEDYDDETDIGSDDERSVCLGSESDRSVDEEPTAEDMEFLDNERIDEPSTSHAALLQNKRNEDEEHFFSRYILFHMIE